MVSIDKKSCRAARARGQDTSLQAEPQSLGADDLPPRRDDSSSCAGTGAELPPAEVCPTDGTAQAEQHGLRNTTGQELTLGFAFI